MDGCGSSGSMCAVVVDIQVSYGTYHGIYKDKRRKDKMKIAFFSGNMEHGGGTERVLSILAGGLADRGHDVMILSLTGKGPAFFELDERIRIYWIGSKTLKSDIIRNLKKLFSIMKDERPDFLVDVDFILGLYSVFLKARFPKIHWISWEHFNYFFKYDANLGLRKIARFIVSRFSDCLVVLSDEDKGYYLSNMKLRCRLERIYNPSPFNTGVVLGHSDTWVPEHEYCTKKIVLAVGRLTRIKGFDRLLKSWRPVEKKHPDWKLRIVGDGEDKDALKEEADRLDLKNVEFTGQVKNVDEYYKNADFLVLTSRNEGFPMVVLEAMGHGLPVVAFACKAGVSETVADGFNGYLVPEGNIKALAGHMDKLISDGDKCHTMSQNAMLTAELFSLNKILDEWEKLFNSFPSSYPS